MNMQARWLPMAASTDLYNVAVHTSPVLFQPFPADANQNVQYILFGNEGGQLRTAFYNNHTLLYSEDIKFIRIQDVLPSLKSIRIWISDRRAFF
ncbi:hypothetical protein CS542_02020 [Pedobacter sp. IW39]|nr:hypothetical protein CS542_02020 [Pedobacter sp. IW39]